MLTSSIHGQIIYGQNVYGATSEDGCYLAPAPQIISVRNNGCTVQSPAVVPSEFYLELYSSEADNPFYNLEATNVESPTLISVGALSDMEPGSTYNLFWKVVTKNSSVKCPDSPITVLITTLNCPKVTSPIIPFISVKRNSVSIEVPNGLPTSIIYLNLQMRRMQNAVAIEEWVTFPEDVKNEASISMTGLATSRHYQFRFLATCEAE